MATIIEDEAWFCVDCGLILHFSAVQCDGCGTRLAGHRFAGVVFA